MDRPEPYIPPSAQPHKAVIRISVEIYPVRPDGELHPVPSSIDTTILDVIFGENLEESSKLAQERKELWMKKVKSES